MSHSLLKNLALNWISLTLSIAVGFIVSPLVVSALGKEQYGTWALIVSVTAQLTLLDFGIRHALVKYVAHHRAKGEYASLSTVVSTASYLLAGLAIIGFLIIFALLPIFGDLFSIPESYLNIAKIALMISALDFSIEVGFGVYNGVLAGSERYDIINTLNAIRLGFYGVLVIIIIYLDGGLIEIASATLVARLGQRYLMRHYARVLNPDLTVSIHQISGSRAKELLRYGLWAGLGIAAGRLIYQTDSIVVGLYIGPVAVASYAVALILIEQLRMFIQSSSLIITPRLATLLAIDDVNNSRLLILSWVRVSQSLVLFIGLPIIVFGGSFLSLWMGPEFEDARFVLAILVTSFFFLAPSSALNSKLLAHATHGRAVKLQILEGLTNLLLSIFLVRKFGVIGVALGTLIPSIVFTGFILPLLVCRECGIRITEFFKHAYIKSIFPALLQLEILWVIKSQLESNTWPNFILANFLGALCFVFLSYRFILTQDDRTYIRRRLGIE